MRISDWSSDVCSSDLPRVIRPHLTRALHDGRAEIRQLDQRNLFRGNVVQGLKRQPAGDEMIGIQHQSQVGVTHTTHELPGFPYIGYRMAQRSEEHTSELQSLMRISYAVFCLKKKNPPSTKPNMNQPT